MFLSAMAQATVWPARFRYAKWHTNTTTHDGQSVVFDPGSGMCKFQIWLAGIAVMIESPEAKNRRTRIVDKTTSQYC